MNLLDQFGLVFRAMPVATLIVSRQGRIAFCNQALNRLFEYEDDELVGQSVEVLVPEDARGGHSELREAYLQLPHSRGMGTGRELHGVSKSGRLIPVEIGLSHIELDGESHAIASILDVTRLKAEAEKTSLAINAAASAMIMADSEGRIVLANRQTCEMFGYDLAELLDQPIEMLIPDELRRRHRVYRASYSSAPSKRAMGAALDLYGRHKNGTRIPLEIGLTPIDSHGEKFVMATVIDISERKRIEEEIRQKNADLTRLNDELAQFAYSASHDLKAPLATIQGLLVCIEEDVEIGEGAAAIENARRAMTTARDLGQLVEDILGLARSENLTEPHQDVGVAELVDGILERHSVLLADHQVVPQVEIEEDCRIHTQPTRLTLILENLITNAIKYADHQKPARYVRISACRTNGDLLTAVEDNGIGIPDEAAPELFQMFKRFGNHTQSGSGLGLALVKQNVDRLQGHVEWRSTPEGSVFEVALPLKVGDSV